MEKNKNLSDIQFSAYPSTGMTDPAFSAYDPSIEDEDKQVGAMWLHPETGVIDQVYVSPSHQRRGIATQMFEMAKLAHAVKPEGYPYPQHSPARSVEGNAWAKAVGGKLPRKKECISCGLEGHLEEDCCTYD